MKIAIYVPSWPPGSSANGIVTYAAQLVPALRKLGHEVFVITSNFTATTPDAYTVDLNKIPADALDLISTKIAISSRTSFFQCVSRTIAFCYPGAEDAS